MINIFIHGIQGETGGATALSKFFDDIYDAFKLHVDFSVVKAVLVGSPGYLRDSFIAHLVDRSTRSEDSAIAGSRGKFISAHTTTGHRNAAIAEMLADSATLTQLGDAQAADEVS
jgi:protein pelota